VRVVEGLPGGAVTFLFADVEGSTRLVQRLGEDDYATMLAELRRVLRTAVGEHQGREVDCRADELFAVFEQAECAVASATAAQHALARVLWAHGSDVRVRMGLNAGRATVADGAYLGSAVNRASRICSAGHGGQVLVSQTVRDLVADTATWRELGEFVLAGFSSPERIFQLVIPGARQNFPAPRVPRVKAGRRLRWPARRGSPAHTVADVAWKVRILLPRVGDDVREAWGGLGASLFTGQRAAERADVFLSRVDHERLAARLADQQEMIGFSARARREAESIESEVAAVAQVASRRRVLAGSAADAESVIASLEGITPQDITAVRARIVEATTVLDDAVTFAAAHLNPLCYKLNRTRYRGVYRSSGRYVVRYIDTLGAERLRDFESLAEARNFRAACRITEKLGDRSQPNIGRGGEYGGGGGG
jgi:class 3 adenylate cyclase